MIVVFTHHSLFEMKFVVFATVVAAVHSVVYLDTLTANHTDDEQTTDDSSNRQRNTRMLSSWTHAYFSVDATPTTRTCTLNHVCDMLHAPSHASLCLTRSITVKLRGTDHSHQPHHALVATTHLLQTYSCLFMCVYVCMYVCVRVCAFLCACVCVYECV